MEKEGWGGGELARGGEAGKGGVREREGLGERSWYKGEGGQGWGAREGGLLPAEMLAVQTSPPFRRGCAP